LSRDVERCKKDVLECVQAQSGPLKLRNLSENKFDDVFMKCARYMKERMSDSKKAAIQYFWGDKLRREEVLAVLMATFGRCEEHFVKYFPEWKKCKSEEEKVSFLEKIGRKYLATLDRYYRPWPLEKPLPYQNVVLNAGIYRCKTSNLF